MIGVIQGTLKLMKKTIESEFGEPEEFKNIVQLASHICETRSALINYLDEEYQWTLFNVGWENKKIRTEYLSVYCK